MNPGPFTLRQLLLMLEGVRREQWAHTSVLLAVTINANRDPKSDPVSADDLNPYPWVERKKRPVETVSVRELRGVFQQIFNGKRSKERDKNRGR